MTQTQREAIPASPVTLAAILNLHGVRGQVCPFTGRLLAWDAVTARDGSDASGWQDVTGWSRKKLYEWLGY